METLNLSTESKSRITQKIIETASEELRHHSGSLDRDITCMTGLPEPLDEIHFYCYGDIERKPARYQLLSQPPMDDVNCTLYIEPIRVWVNDEEERLLPLDIENIQTEIIYNLEKQ